jgi:hypothetical protein
VAGTPATADAINTVADATNRAFMLGSLGGWRPIVQQQF